MFKKNNEQGRSMLEMILVLAIVAVLSIIAIVGFSKVLEHYKETKLKEQISAIQSNMIEKFSSIGNYKLLGSEKENATNFVRELGVFPEDMIQSDGSIRHAFGGHVYVWAVSYDDKENIAFKVEFENMPQAPTVRLSTDSSNETNPELLYIELN